MPSRWLHPERLLRRPPWKNRRRSARGPWYWFDFKFWVFNLSNVSVWYFYYRFDMLFVQKLRNVPTSTCTLARYYPKTTIPMAPSCQPRGFTSVLSSYSWPTVFMERMVQQFGEDFMIRRLRSWKWSCSTAFSGVGAPESVSTPIMFGYVWIIVQHWWHRMVDLI